MSDDRIRVLLIEDDPLQAVMIQRMLSEKGDFMYAMGMKGIDFGVASTLAQGMEHIGKEEVDAIFLDLMLPDSRGIDTLMKLRQWRPDVAIVVLTVLNDESIAMEAMRAGAQDYLIKSEVHGSTLIRTLRHAIERNHMLLELASRTRKLQAEEERLRAMIHGMAEGVVFADQHDIVTEVNDWFVGLMGLSRDHIIGHSIWEFHPPEERDTIRQGLDGFRQGSRDIIVIEVDLRGIHAIVRIQPIRREDEYRGSILNIIDVSNLVEARIAAEQSANTKSAFLTNISHEIRTPMNGIIGMIDFLLETTLSSEQRDYIQTIRTCTDGLMVVINDILDLSKIEAGKLELEHADFDLRECVEEVGELLALKAHEKGLELAVIIPSGMPRMYVGDKGRLRQILLNLVNNAIKFTESDEVVVCAEVLDMLNDNQARLRIMVRDTGIGISPADRNKLFQPFSQIDHASTRRYGGTGLGLAICKHLVSIMGGEIGVESELGTGSLFWFTVVFDLSQMNVSGEEMRPTLKDIRILIVDDNGTNRRILSHQLREQRCWECEAKDGYQALSLLRKWAGSDKEFDIVLVDYLMPGMDGIELTKQIKNDPSLAHTSLVMLTSEPNAGDESEMARLGLDAYLIKPVRQKVLMETLHRVVSRRHSARHSAPQGAPESVEPMGGKPRALLVEDDEICQKVARHMLGRLGFECEVAVNGQDALEKIEAASYDIVFMDCRMPVMDGYEATRRIRDNGALPKQPLIIAMTSQAMVGDRERCLQAGMDDYISKPIHQEKLRSMLHKYLQM
ncbi:MAG: response regulator [bacterium]